jgi:hypothetical protein
MQRPAIPHSDVRLLLAWPMVRPGVRRLLRIEDFSSLRSDPLSRFYGKPLSPIRPIEVRFPMTGRTERNEVVGRAVAAIIVYVMNIKPISGPRAA